MIFYGGEVCMAQESRKQVTQEDRYGNVNDVTTGCSQGCVTGSLGAVTDLIISEHITYKTSGQIIVAKEFNRYEVTQTEDSD